jgi:hypothetical protein
VAGDNHGDITQPEVDAIIAATLDGFADRGQREALLDSFPLATQVAIESAVNRNRAAVARERAF